MYNLIDSNKRKSWFLIAFFIIFILLIGWFFGKVTNSGYSGIIIAGVIAILMSLTGYFSGDRLALTSAGAKPAKPTEHPQIHRLVENLAITAGIPKPKVYIIPDNSLNAFATGRDPKHASIAVTSGLIKNLEKSELEGVIAHELSHIKNYDIRLMTLIVVLVGIISLLSHWFFRFSLFGGGRNRNNKGQGQLGMIMMVIGIALIVLSPIIAQLIKLAVSRKREYLADASGVLLTRYPQGLANALEKIKQYNQPLKSANGATAHLYISNPFGNKKRMFSGAFNTHPPIDKRIQALRGLKV